EMIKSPVYDELAQAAVFSLSSIIDAIPLPVKRSALVDCALCCTHLHAIGNLDNRCAREQLLDAADCIHCSFTQSRNPMIYVIKLSKHCALFPGISKFLNRLLDSLHSSGKAAAALFDDAAFVAGEFIEDGARQYQLNIPHADELFKCGQNRLLLIVLRKIEPTAGIDKNLEQAVFLPSADRRHSLGFCVR